MPRKKKQVPDATEAMKVGTRAEIRERLALWVERKFDGNWSYFARSIGASDATVEEWKPAKKGAPRLDQLRRLAEHRLSLDWLFRGVGEMEWETIEPQSASGTLLLMMRPILARRAGAGEMAADEAFSRLLLRHSNAQLLEMAATGLLPSYMATLDAIARRDTATRLTAYVNEQLELIEAAAGARGELEAKAILRELLVELGRNAAHL